MPRVVRVKNESGGWHGWRVACPGCHRWHVFSTEEPNKDGARWWFNGDTERPTFRPSMLEREGHGADRRVCHSSVREGRIHFHAECTHGLAGQVVDLPDARSAEHAGGWSETDG